MMTTLITSCSNIPNSTINPFYSSFEDNDQIACNNVEYTRYTGITELSTVTGTGPTFGYNLNANTTDIKGYGFNGLKSFSYQAITNNTNNVSFSNYLYKDLNIQVGSQTELSYKIFPTLGDNSITDVTKRYESSYVAIDLLYSDNNANDIKRLSLNPKIIDQNGYHLDAYSQGASKTLYSNQWNSKRIDLSPIAGKYIKGILLTYDLKRPTDLTIAGFVDDISIADKVQSSSTSLTDLIDTRRGTNTYNGWNQDGKQFSRGLCVPYATVPNGFNFYTPFTSTNDYNWIYTYAANNSINNNLPMFTGLGFSHEPSPWMGDHNSFAMMPGITTSADAQALGNIANRGIEFKHSNEIAHPDYYSVTLEDGIKSEIAPGDHSAIFRFTFPKASKFGSLVFDSGKNNDQYVDKYWYGTEGGFTNNNEFAGYVDNGTTENGQRKNGGSRMFIYGMFSNDDYKINQCSDDTQRQNLNFCLDLNKTLEVKFATSYISIEQAKINLQQEILNHDYKFDDLKNASQILWNNRLAAIQVDSQNVNDEQKHNLYESLYRLNLYPNKYFENIGTTDHPSYYHASPVLPTSGILTDEHTNAQVLPGKMYVNNGFWDTYRTVWPLYQLLYPNLTTELINGFLLQYEEGGWIARWSAPGYADMMPGTSSDAAFCDAYTSGVIKDPATILNVYNASLKNAMVVPDSLSYGRKFLNQSLYLGYAPAPANDSDETLSWTLENHINNYALSQLAYKLVNDNNLTDSLIETKTGQTRAQIRSIAQYFYNESQNYPLSFDNDAKFFRGKQTNGQFAQQNEPNGYNPLNWYYENTEASGWNYAFSVPYDIPGLISLYGNQTQFINKLDEYFTTPEDGKHYGNRGVASLEMFEARDVRWGQFSFSNQPSHHIPYLYAAAGRPNKTEAIIHEVLNRLYIGGDIGQGYPGDEDNGEMSAWYILSAIGLYDLAHGSGKYTITSPAFEHIVINRDNGAKIKINSQKDTNDSVYIKSAQLDGKFFNEAQINQTTLLTGNHTINYKLTNDHNVPWGIQTIGNKSAEPINDVTGLTTSWNSAPARTLTTLFDKNANTSVDFAQQDISLTYDRNSSSIPINQFSLTTNDNTQLFSEVIIKSRNNTTDDWTVLNQWSNQQFIANEMKIFPFTDNMYRYYQIEIIGNANVNLAELRLLNLPNE